MRKKIHYGMFHIKDSEMNRIFSENFDGRWHESTKELLKNFDLKKYPVRLDRLWCQTSEHYNCPICGRSKSHLIKLSKNGTIFLGLCRHHDHICDYVSEIARGKNIDSTVTSCTVSMVQKFESTLCCFDCNSADAVAKTKLNLPIFFSYSPSEIESFINPSGNKPHEVDLGKAEEIYLARKPEFEYRTEISKRILSLKQIGNAERREVSTYDFNAMLYSIDKSMKSGILKFEGFKNLKFDSILELSGLFFQRSMILPSKKIDRYINESLKCRN